MSRTEPKARTIRSETLLTLIAAATTALTFVPFVMFRAAVHLPESAGVSNSTFSMIYHVSLANTGSTSLAGFLTNCKRHGIGSSVASFAPVAVILVVINTVYAFGLIKID